MMDFGGLDVGINCKYTSLFDDPDEPLFTLIDQGVHGGQATRSTLVENVFSDSFDDDSFAIPLYERKLLMTMQMASSASSMGLGQAGRAGSLTSFDTRSSRNFFDDTYDLVRERNPSTSSFTGPCIPPDLMMNTSLNSSTDEFLVDSLPVIEDLQDQIFLEEGHQNLQPDDLLIPLDEAIDGKALQEQLINQITGNNQSLLAVDTCEGNTPPNLVDLSPSKSEVKKVETTPGSQNVCIDGTDVELPAGSVVLAVMNENGALVTLPTPASSCGDEVTKLSSSPEFGPTSGPLFSCVTVSTRNSNLPSTSSMDKVPTPLEIHRVNENEGGSNPCLSANKEITDGYSKDLKVELIDGCGDAYPNIGTFGPQNGVPFSVKREVLHVSPDQSDAEDVFVDVETVSDTTPVIEAVDLDTLLAEFEATETANIQVEKKPQPTLDLDEGDFLGFETPHPNDPGPSLKARSLLMKKEVKEYEDSEQQASPVESSVPSHNAEKGEQPVKQAKKLELESKTKLQKRMTHQKIKDSLPVEIIEKIKASSKRSRTKVLPEPLVPVPKAKKSHSKSKLLKKKCLALKRQKKLAGRAQKAKDGSESPIPTPIDHTYCYSPEKKSLEKDSVNSSPKVFNKLPDYVQDSPPEDKVKTSLKSEVVCKKDSGVESDMSGSSLEIKQKEQKKEDEAPKSEESIPTTGDEIAKKEIENEGPLYSRLPDYVTDISNVKPKVEVVEGESECKTEELSQEIPESSLDNTLQVEIKEEQPKKKKKLKLDEYRMRMISSANNSRSNSPLVGEDPLVKKVCKNQGVEESTEIKVESSATANLPSNAIVEEREEGEIKEDPDDGSALNIPQDAIEPIVIKTVPTPKKHSHRETKMAAYRDAKSAGDREAKTGGNREAKMATLSEKKEPNSRSAHVKPPKTTCKQPTVIEIDLVEEEDKEKERQQKGQTKLGLIDSLPLSKMPTTSLGHSLLYSRRNGDNPDKKVSNHHRFSSSGSRSPSWSSKRSSRSYKSKESSRYTSHRKSRRRWSRSRSRGRSRSRSYSASSTSSFTSLSSRSRSRSRSTSYSKSYNSRSRSRSRSNRRWDRSRSRRSKRYSRSKERSKDRSRRRSWSKSPQEWGSSWKRVRSPNWGYHSRSTYTYGPRYPPPAPPSARYKSRHRNSEHADSEGDDRKIIYVGSINEGTTRADLRRKFDKFGPIVDINIHFRENGDNYGFVTFRYQQHANDAMEHGNDDPNLPEYSLCFGGRRTFCKVEYSDLDAQNEDYEYHVTPATMDYDTLLKSTLHMRR